MHSALKNKKVWIFDLDSTLYPKSCGFEASRESYKVFARLKGCTYDEAKSLYSEYAVKYGAAPFTGIVKESGIDISTFIEEAFVNVPLDSMPVSDELPILLNSLKATKLVLSNCPKLAIDTILSHLNIAECFSDIYGLERLNYVCKPHSDAFLTVLNDLDIPAEDCVMVEDSLANIQKAKALGMTTVLIGGVLGDPAVDFQFVTIEDALKSSVQSHS